MTDELGLLEDDKEKAIVIRVETVVDEARTREVKDEGQYYMMAEFLLTIKSLMKDIKDYWDPSIRNANKTVKDLRNKKNAQIVPLENAEAIAKTRMTFWWNAEEAKRLKAEEEAREKARKAEEKRQKAIEAAKKSAEAGEPVSTVLQKEIQEPEPVPEVVVDEVPKVAGISYSDKWRWECENFANVSNSWKTLDEVKINGYVRSMKGDAKIEGIRVYLDKTLSARG